MLGVSNRKIFLFYQLIFLFRDEKKRFIDTTHMKHNLQTYSGDFSKFNYPRDHFDVIVALNSVYYMFNQKTFQDQIPFFKTLISSLKIGGILFLDKMTFSFLGQYKEEGITNINLKNLGGFPIQIFQITRET